MATKLRKVEKLNKILVIWCETGFPLFRVFFFSCFCFLLAVEMLSFCFLLHLIFFFRSLLCSVNLHFSFFVFSICSLFFNLFICSLICASSFAFFYPNLKRFVFLFSYDCGNVKLSFSFAFIFFFFFVFFFVLCEPPF